MRPLVTRLCGARCPVRVIQWLRGRALLNTCIGEFMLALVNLGGV